MKNKKIIEFECKRCGFCCREMRGPMMGMIHGLMIFLQERGLFPQKHIKPLFRYTEQYHPLPGFIFMYQVDAPGCPHFDEEVGCLIYEKRPLTCKAFPFEPTGRGIAIHDSCPEMQRLIEEKPTAIRPPQSYFTSMAMIQHQYNKWLITPHMERFNLEDQRWHTMDDSISKEDRKRFGWR